MLELIRAWKETVKPVIFWCVIVGIPVLLFLLLFFIIWWIWPTPAPTDRDLLDKAANSIGQSTVHEQVAKTTQKAAIKVFKAVEIQQKTLQQKLAAVAKQAKEYQNTMKRLGEGDSDWKKLDAAAGVSPE